MFLWTLSTLFTYLGSLGHGSPVVGVIMLKITEASESLWEVEGWRCKLKRGTVYQVAQWSNGQCSGLTRQ